MNVSWHWHLFAFVLPLVLSACAHRHGDRAATIPPLSGAPQPLATASTGRSVDSGSPNSGGSDSGGTVDVATRPKAGQVVVAGHTRKPGKPGKTEKQIPVLHLDGENEVADEVKPTVPPAPSANGRQDEPSAKQPSALTLADLEQIALQSNPSLMQLAAVVDKARGIHEQVGLYPNPVIGYFGEEIGDNGTAGKQGGFVGQTIVTADKLKLNRDVASWNIQELSWEYQAQRYRVLNDVRLRYYDVLGAQQRLKTAGELLKVAQQGVKIAAQLFKAKQTSRADVLQAKVDLNQIQIIQRNATYEYEAAWKRLATLLGRPQMAARNVAGTLTGTKQQWNWEPTYQRLLSESPQLEAARSRIQGALAAIRRQEVQPIPNLLTQVNVAHDNASGDNLANVQIGIPLPVFNRNQGNICLAQAEYQRAYRDAERLQLQLRDELAIAFRNFQQAQFQVKKYENDILENAKESLRLTEDSYQAGQINFLRVLTARRTFFEANLRYVDALIALRKSNVVIDGFVLTGGLTDVPDIGSRALNGLGQRGQALSGQ